MTDVARVSVCGFRAWPGPGGSGLFCAHCPVPTRAFALAVPVLVKQRSSSTWPDLTLTLLRAPVHLAVPLVMTSAWQKIALVHGLHRACFLNFLKSTFWSLKKNQTKNLDVLNYVHYERTNFESQIPCSLGSANKTNLTHFRQFENCILISTILLVLLMIEYNIFRLENLHSSRINHWLRVHICFGIFVQL
jgi:hypothetical protein